ncbi:hypothetical protein SAMN05444161_3471 [Rhizobiales bacterium GAS191]|nr:hypothetical protein SAMN05519103_02638 [Rhizobiales bacterium GAS113]SED55940.1 hypothetical protein SAMN05444161_3471 [Rhizobiales bacterium GAS191]
MQVDASPVRAHVVAACLFGGVALAIVAGPMLAQGNLPGDLGDTRFNTYILEHVYRWLLGLEPHLLAPGLYYPFPDAIFFSDTHAGTAFIYAVFRALGAPRFLAFDLWFFAGYVATYLAAHYAFARMGAGAVTAGLGAAIFTFSLPSLAQFNHCQLVYRCGVPLAMLHLWEGLRGGSARDLLLSAFWLCVQTLISVYLGFFLFLLMAAFTVVLPLSTWRSRDWQATARLAGQGLARIVRVPGKGDVALLLATAAAGAATVALLWFYGHTSRLYGMARSWEEISSMLPRPGSYLVMDLLSYWYGPSHMLSGVLPMRPEHQMFMGVGVALLFLAGIVTLVVRPRAARNLPAGAMLLALAVLVLATLSIHGHSFYAVLVHVPGLNAIRAVTRIIVVLMFPVAMIAVVGLRGLAEEVRPIALGRLAALICGLAALYEVAMAGRLMFSADAAQRRVDAVIAEARRLQGGVEQPILALVGQDGEMTHLDGELAAQELGWPTVNGYSGSVPPGSYGQPNCNYAIRHFGAFDFWRKEHKLDGSPSISQLLRRTVFVGWPDCRGVGILDNTISVSIGHPPSNGLPEKVILTSGELQRREDLIAFTVHIRNASDELMPMISAAPIRVAWRFVPDDERVVGQGWSKGEALLGDIAPGAEQSLVITDELPRQAGSYRLQVSLVANGLYWFHDKGMRILTIPEPVAVP